MATTGSSRHIQASSALSRWSVGQSRTGLLPCARYYTWRHFRPRSLTSDESSRLESYRLKHGSSMRNTHQDMIPHARSAFLIQPLFRDQRHAWLTLFCQIGPPMRCHVCKKLVCDAAKWDRRYQRMQYTTGMPMHSGTTSPLRAVLMHIVSTCSARCTDIATRAARLHLMPTLSLWPGLRTWSCHPVLATSRTFEPLWPSS